MSMLTYSFPKSVRQTVMSYTCTDPKTPVNSGHFYLMCNGPSLRLYLIMSFASVGETSVLFKPTIQRLTHYLIY